MESIGQEYMGFYNDGKGNTPFWDSLMTEGLYFEHSFANAGRSNMAVVALTTGIPALMDDAFMISRYQGNRIKGMAKILGEFGYQSGFFHGGNEGTFNFDKFTIQAGYDRYYDRRDYGLEKDYDGNWGIYDWPFFKFSIEKMSEFKSPFLATIFSISAHHPHKIEPYFEEAYPNMPVLERSVLYSDYAMRQFFKEAKEKPWFDQTLFIILSDHIGLIQDPSYSNSVGAYKIPILFYKPDGSLKEKRNDIIQQHDIMPSVLDYLNYPKPFYSFGKSIFTNEKRFAYTFTGGIYQILDTQYTLKFDGKKSISLYDYNLDPTFQHNLIDQNLPIKETLETALKAVIQVHHEAMINNKLSYEQKEKK